jgi:hypothetical protein
MVEVVRMQAKTKKELKEARERTLKNFYQTLEMRRQWEQLGDVGGMAAADDVMAQCLQRLCLLRAQEIMGSWPQLLPAY